MCSSTNLKLELSAISFQTVPLFPICLIGIGHTFLLNCYLLSNKALGHSSSNFQQIQSLPFVSINNNVRTLSKNKHKNAGWVNTGWKFKGVKVNRQQTVPVANIVYMLSMETNGFRAFFWSGYTCHFSVPSHHKTVEKLRHQPLVSERMFEALDLSLILDVSHLEPKSTNLSDVDEPGWSWDNYQGRYNCKSRKRWLQTYLFYGISFTEHFFSLQIIPMIGFLMKTAVSITS